MGHVHETRAACDAKFDCCESLISTQLGEVRRIEQRECKLLSNDQIVINLAARAAEQSDCQRNEIQVNGLAEPLHQEPFAPAWHFKS
jgi:hypothetical protein